LKSKDNQFAAVKLPKCLERPHNSTKNSRIHHRNINISRDDHSSMHNTKPNPTRQHSRKTSSAALYAHGVISLSFTANSHVRDWTRYTISSLIINFSISLAEKGIFHQEEN